MTTAFASADRANPAEVVKQVKIFRQDRELCSLLDLMPDFILILNAHRQAVYANKVLLNFLTKSNIMDIAGLRPGEILNCIHWIEDGYEGCGTTGFCKVCGAVNAIINSLHKVSDIKECSVTSVDKTCFNFRVWTSPYEKKGENYVLFILRDISIEKYHNALERIFFHDVLNTVTGLYGLLAVIGDSAEKFLQFAGLFKKQTDKLHEEINSHRDMMLAESGEIIPDRAEISSLALLNEAVRAAASYDTARNKVITLDQAAENIVFSSDSKLIRRVLDNMLKNALEASENGDEIIAGCFRYDDKIRFFVHNPGYIDDDVQLNVFQRSFSTRGKGRGWGTYSMKLLSENILQGRVSFQSTRESGTAFYADYPFEIIDNVDKQAPCLN